MKLSEYLPELPAYADKMTQLNESLNFLQLAKSGNTGQAPTIGLDHVVNTWVRHQMAYRQQLIMDLQMVTFSVEEIRAPLHHITNEVFRRGINWKPKVEKPDQDQIARLKVFLDDCNIFDQSLEEVLRQFHFDVNSIDDGFLYIAKEYKETGDGKLRSKVKEIRRLNPALVEFDLDAAGLPKNAHFICPIHREKLYESPKGCEAEGCRGDTQPVMYKYYHRNKHIYLLDSEIIHLSKFSPSETYGWSPLLTIFEKALTLIGMDKNLYRYFFERKMPASMIMVHTDDPESLRRERSHIAAQTRQDPNYIPMVAVSSRNQRGRVDMVRLFHTLQEMDYLPVRNEIRERIAAMWGVTPAWQGAPEAFGGLSTQTQQLVVMSRVVESDQRLFHEKVFPQILNAFGVTDWELELPLPEEKAEATRISFAQQRAQVVNMYLQLGYEVKLKDDNVPLEDAEFMLAGKAVPMAQMQAEQMAMGLDQMEQQSEMQQQMMQQGSPTGVNQAPGREGAAPGGGEGAGAAPAPAIPLQGMDLSKSKFNGRFGGQTPDWHGKTPMEERDIDEYAKGRDDADMPKGMGTPKKIKPTMWMNDLSQKGYTSPVIKDVTADGKQMWFVQDGVDYVADLTQNGVLDVQKASFSNRFQGTPPDKDQHPMSAVEELFMNVTELNDAD